MKVWKRKLNFTMAVIYKVSMLVTIPNCYKIHKELLSSTNCILIYILNIINFHFWIYNGVWCLKTLSLHLNMLF